MKARERIFGKEEKTGDITPGNGNRLPVRLRDLIRIRNRGCQRNVSL